ncbi:DUF4158 domain-containing protein [Streptomyces sp. NPDC001732]
MISVGRGARGRQDWEPEDLIEVWTLLEDDLKRVRNKSGATRLGFALLLKFFEVEVRFPESAKEGPAAAVEYVAQQVKVSAEAWADHGWQGKAIQRQWESEACPSTPPMRRPRQGGGARTWRQGMGQPGPARRPGPVGAAGVAAGLQPGRGLLDRRQHALLGGDRPPWRHHRHGPHQRPNHRSQAAPGASAARSRPGHQWPTTP